MPSTARISTSTSPSAGSPVHVPGCACPAPPAGSTVTALLQLGVARSPFEAIGPDGLRPPVFQGSFGVRRWLRHGSFTVAMVENLLFFDNSADIGIHVGLTRSF